jgi:TonB-linked SusC/RagA family outer membrane protein
MRIPLFLWVCFSVSVCGVKAQVKRPAGIVKDTLVKLVRDTKKQQVSFPQALLKASLFPSSSVQQDLKGRSAGLYVQEPSGEPGTYQYMYIRGAAAPLLSVEDLIKSQPLVVVDGLPIVSNEHPFAYDVQVYDYTRIGPSTNLLAGINMDNVESITVMKNIADYAAYGPRAANGVIFIKTKGSQIKKRIDFDSYFGVATRPSVTTINGRFENDFRQQFYKRYASQEQVQNYAPYLKDSMNAIYYGPSDWTDSYYRNALIYSANASITGGSNRAHFKFGVGTQNNKGVADQTALEKYNVNFVLNMKPTQWLNVVASINAARLGRKRNKYNRDRFAEARYLPELSQPLSPNNIYYGKFLSNYANSIDNNVSNIVDATFLLNAKLGKLNLSTTLGLSYTDGQRDIFHPTALMEGTKYISNYIGYNQRMVLDNKATYTYKVNKDHSIDMELGQSIHWDTYRYNYAHAYGQGGSDYMKVNLLQSDPNKADYLGPLALTRRLVFRFLDKTANNLVSFYGKFTYNYKDRFTVTGLMRADGSSNAQPTDPWFYSPVISGTWNAKNHLLANVKSLSALKFRASYGLLGRVELNDRFAQGPQYMVDMGWSSEPLVQSFSSTVGLVRPYTKGYVGYNIPWSYNEQLTAGVDAGFWNNRVTASIDLYSVTTKRQLIGIPSYAEYGYTKSYEAGMDVNNSGIDLTLSANVFPAAAKFQWTTAINANFNRNKLKALPRGQQQLIIGDRLLKVGESVDRFWVLQNEGMFFTDDEVPVDSKTGKRLNYQGIPLIAGDPRWVDRNGDYRIDANDKVLTGHILPVVAGGFNNSFSYNGWSLTMDFYYNLGRNIVNQQMSNRFNFINQESANNINSIKEISFWEKQGDYSLYPVYNPWSTVIPYRVDQDLFLENASFVKLRNVSLGYELSGLIKKKAKKTEITRCFVYCTANNLFTITPYSGRDPELVSYTGYDTGYGLPIPRTYTVGVKMSL